MASLTHLIGTGGVTASSFKYRARTDVAANLKIEYSVNSNLSSSTISSGVTTASGDDFTGGETISGLATNQLYYYSILVDNVRQHNSPYPTVKTFPTEGVDANIKIVTISCQENAPTGTTAFAAIADENPTIVIQMGDFSYPDTTDITTQRTKYKEQYTQDYLNEIAAHFPVTHTWDDHDFGGNNVSGALANKANSLQVFKEYRITYDLANGSNGVWHKFTCANAEFFVLDTRYQRESSKPRFPDSFPDITRIADTGSSGNLLVVRAADVANPIGTIGTGGTWYGGITTSSGTYYRKVTALWQADGTRTVTLSASVPDLDDTSTYFFRCASMLDMDALADDQTDWLITNINASTKRFKFIVSSSCWNPTLRGSGSGDAWGGWETGVLDNAEQNYIIQEITAENVFVLSGDRHHAGIDDGTNSIYPEMMSSPLNTTPLAVAGGEIWSNGSYTTGRNYGVVTISGLSINMTVKEADGDASPITPYGDTFTDPDSQQYLSSQVHLDLSFLGRPCPIPGIAMTDQTQHQHAAYRYTEILATGSLVGGGEDHLLLLGVG